MSTSAIAPGPSSKRQLVARAALGRQAEAVEVGDRPGRVPRGALEVGALRVGDREHDDLGHVFRDAKDLLDLRRVLQRCRHPSGAEPAGTQGEAEAPGRLDHGVEQAGPPAAVVAADDGRDDDGGDLGEMFGEVRRGCHHLLAGMAGALQPFGSGGHERQRRLAIELAELVLDPLLADDDPSPAAQVAAGRCLLGDVDAVEQQLVVDRSLQVEPPANRAGGGEHLVDLGDIEGHGKTRSTIGTSLVGCVMDARSEHGFGQALIPVELRRPRGGSDGRPRGLDRRVPTWWRPRRRTLRSTAVSGTRGTRTRRAERKAHRWPGARRTRSSPP